MKQSILIVIFAIQVALVSPVHAWFPEDALEFATDARRLCAPAIVSDEQDQTEDEQSQDELDEEPDCE